MIELSLSGCVMGIYHLKRLGLELITAGIGARSGWVKTRGWAGEISHQVTCSLDHLSRGRALHDAFNQLAVLCRAVASN